MRVLVADDSMTCRKSLEDCLTLWGYEVLLATNGAEAWEILRQDDSPSMAVLDHTMPEMTGLEVCKATRERSSGQYVYIIMLSAKSEQEDVLEGFELGADDYLTKPYSELTLRARLRVGERIIRAQRELLEMRENLQYQATHDSMTGLWNNAAIAEILSKEIKRSERHGMPLSVCLVDLDHFKLINDTYGHLIGDEVLRATTHRIKGAMREYDSLGRYGGEEFLAVLPGCSAKDAIVMAERMRVLLIGEPLLVVPAAITVTASIGVCEWQPRMGVNQVFSGADRALYAAKTAGRNRVQTV